ncbi:hypothetical protein [Neorhizobium sp. DT-125]|uniref:hypothetical protein n=1 Tax=Neorhizobium sp. DT-125 TaxID=3396163 RepID=UPI003F1B3198
MQYSTRARLLCAGAALSMFAGPAFALDGNDLVAKINNVLSVQSAAGFSAESAAVNGQDVTLTNARFTANGGKQSFPLGTIRFQGVAEDNGDYTVETVSFDNVNVTNEGVNFTASDISMSGLVIPSDPNGDSLDAVLLYDEAHIGEIAATIDGKPAFSVDEVNLTTDIADDNSSLGFDLEANGIKSDLSLVEDPKAREAIQQLGLTSIDGKITMRGNWTLADGTIDIDEYAFDFANIGRLDIALSVTGYTLDFAKSVNETVKTMEANPNRQEAQQAANLAMLGLMQRLTFNSAEIRFEDAGITRRALDFAGKSQGTTGEQMAQMLKGMTPLMLAQYNVPELQNMLSAAVNTYLDNPGSFTISAEPENAVPFPMIMGAAMGAPNTLPQVLGVKVTAND